MSDQNKTNLQTIGAGLVGFVAVVAVGGGFLLLHSKLTAPSASRPAPAAAPIDLEAGTPRRPVPSAPFERREQSPAPLVGADSEDVPPASQSRAGERSDASAAVSAAAAGAVKGRGGPASLEIRDRLVTEASSTAVAKVEEAEKADKAEKPGKGKSAPKLAVKAPPAGDGASGADAAVASVRYGVKSRSELMGRAAGPVYNVTGGSAKGGTTAGAGKVAPLGAQIGDVKKQLENSNLPADQRAALLKQLEQAGGLDVEAAPK